MTGGEDWVTRATHPRLGSVTILEGIVRIGTPHCDECGGEIPPGSEIYALLSREGKESETHCGSCFRDDD